MCNKENRIFAGFEAFQMRMSLGERLCCVIYNITVTAGEYDKTFFLIYLGRQRITPSYIGGKWMTSYDTIFFFARFKYICTDGREIPSILAASYWEKH